MGLILLVVILLFLFGSWPTWRHSRDWGYGPSGGLGLVLILLVVLMLVGTVPWGCAPRYYVVNPPPRPVVIDRRPVTVVNPPATPNKQESKPPVPDQ